MAWALPIVKYRAKLWFVDARLLELRSIRRPWERVSFQVLSEGEMENVLAQCDGDLHARLIRTES